MTIKTNYKNKILQKELDNNIIFSNKILTSTTPRPDTTTTTTTGSTTAKPYNYWTTMATSSTTKGVTNYEYSTVPPVSIKKNKDFLQNIINRMKDPNKVSSKIIDALFEEDIKELEMAKKQHSGRERIKSNEVTVNETYDTSIAIYDEDYDTLPESYPKLTYEVENDDVIDNENVLSKVEEIEDKFKLPEGYPGPNKKFEDDVVKAAKER